MRRLPPLVLLALACSACSGGSDDSAETTLPVRTTPESIRLAVFERSYSECASYDLQRLAAKYRVDARPQPVAFAVARAWTQQFGGGQDAEPSGRDGCFQALREKTG
jgi:hypothetical protein